MKSLTRLKPCLQCTDKALHRPSLLSFPFPRWYSSSVISSRSWSTPLAEKLAKAIAATGPISLASYMRQCLTSPGDGYYNRKNDERTDPFGVSGDFVTAPEISQVFGELVGLWILTEWLAQGQRRNGVHLVELGPGRGTLMADLLRATEKFTPFNRSIDTVYMIESSPTLREKQRRLLCGDNPFREIENGWECSSSHSRSLRVVWLEGLKYLPTLKDGHSPFFVAHEFFDALPIHAFQAVARSQLSTGSSTSPTENLTYKSGPKLLDLKTAPRGQGRPNVEPKYEWRELVVSNTSDPKAPSSSEHTPEFQLSRSPGITPHSAYLPSISSRYSSVLSMPDATIEISPESLSITGTIAKHIGSREKPLGAALIIDYGTRETIPGNTLRGIRSHKLVSPFSSPGLTDLSASVDFVGLAYAALEATDEVEVIGPASQWQFLMEMGIEARGTALEAKAPTNEAKKRINEGWKRLIDRSQRGMGLLYNVLTIVPKGRAAGGVVGFGGQLGGDNVAPLMSKSNN